MKRGALIATCAFIAALNAGAAHAAVGAPTPAGLDLQPAASSVAQAIHEFHSFILVIIVAITLLVLALLLWVIVRYNRRANPTPRKFTHNIAVEVIWTIVPVLILVAIAWKSFPLIYMQERVPAQTELTLKVTGNSWRWDFEYPDLGVMLTSNMLDEETARAEDRPYLLATDTPLYVPVDTNVRVLITSNDVIHSFGVPALGVKEDAIQGRVNETWFNIDSDLFPAGSVIYGQCYELCGINHAYMPIEIVAVTREEFEQWVATHGGSMASVAPAQGEQAPPGDAAPATQEPAAPAATPTR